MKLNYKKIFAVIMCTAMAAITLTGCGKSKGDEASYTKGLLEVAYFAQKPENIDTLSMKKDETDAASESSCEKEAQFIASYFNMENVSDDTIKSFKEAAKKLGAAADYSVNANGDKVTVTIKPLIVKSEELEKYVEEFAVKKYVDADKNCTEKEFVDGAVKILEKAAFNPKYADEVKIDITVSSKDGKYEISDEDLAKIDNAMFVY